jgi:hypothetical protein
MTTKLTLSLNPEIIKKAKRISQEKGMSISKIVEGYFESMESDMEKKLEASKNLSGKLKNRVSEHFDWKKELATALIKKHG